MIIIIELKFLKSVFAIIIKLKFLKSVLAVIFSEIFEKSKCYLNLLYYLALIDLIDVALIEFPEILQISSFENRDLAKDNNNFVMLKSTIA